MDVHIGTTSKREFNRMLRELLVSGRSVCGVRYISEETLKRMYPIDLLTGLAILAGTAVGFSSDGSKRVYRGIDDAAIKKVAQSKWVIGSV